MSPDELIASLEPLGIKLSRGTLQRWTRAGLIPAPATGSHGRGGGRFTDYPPEATAEAAASWWTLRYPGMRPTLPTIAEARRRALELHREMMTHGELAAWPGVRELMGGAIPRLHVAWLAARAKAEHRMALDRPARVSYRWSITGTPKGGDFRLEFVGVTMETAQTDKISMDFRRADV